MLFEPYTCSFRDRNIRLCSMCLKKTSLSLKTNFVLFVYVLRTMILVIFILNLNGRQT